MRNYKKFLAVVLAGTMIVGNAAVVLAEDNNSTSVEGNGDYEGDKADYPVASLTLPTELSDTLYDYIADPNGLIAGTTNAAYGSSASFSSDGKLWFLSATDTYTKESAAVSVTSKNARDVDVSVKLEVSNSDSVSTGVGISSDSSFTDDTNTNLYFAIVDTDTTDTKVADVPLTSLTQAVTMTKTIPGVKDNYELQYASDTYSYVEKSGATGWGTFEYKLTGAINTQTGVEWDGITTLPTLKVTWSWKEHTDAPTVSMTNAGLLTIAGLSEDASFSSVNISYTSGGKAGTYAFNTASAVWSPSAPTSTTTGTVTCQLDNAWITLLNGSTTTPVVTLTYTTSDGTTKTVSYTTTFGSAS